MSDWLPESGTTVVEAPWFERYGDEFNPQTGACCCQQIAVFPIRLNGYNIGEHSSRSAGLFLYTEI